VKIQPNTYFGTPAKSIRTGSFNTSITEHPAHSQISAHAHSKPYLGILASGIYNEDSTTSDQITSGDILNRAANYEHVNRFSNQRTCPPDKK